MSLFSKLGDAFESLQDKIDLPGGLDDKLEELISSGKCPDKVKDAFEALKDVDPGDAADKVKQLASTLGDHLEDLPDEIKEKVQQFKK